jgi:hypothetical protein
MELHRIEMNITSERKGMNLTDEATEIWIEGVQNDWNN